MLRCTWAPQRCRQAVTEPPSGPGPGLRAPNNVGSRARGDLGGLLTQLIWNALAEPSLLSSSSVKKAWCCSAHLEAATRPPHPPASEGLGPAPRTGRRGARGRSPTPLQQLGFGPPEEAQCRTGRTACRSLPPCSRLHHISVTCAGAEAQEVGHARHARHA